MSNEPNAITTAEALKSLEYAAEVANNSLDAAIEKCTTDDCKEKVIDKKNLIDAAYLESLYKSLQDTSARVKLLSDSLKSEADEVKKKSNQLRKAVDAINLFTELVKLATELALFFA